MQNSNMSPPGSAPLPFLLRSCVQAKGIKGRFLSPCCKIGRNGRSTGADNGSSSPSFTAMVAEPEWTGLLLGKSKVIQLKRKDKQFSIFQEVTVR